MICREDAVGRTSIGIAVAVAAIMAGCAGRQGAVPPPLTPYTPSFTFDPKEAQAAEQLPITIGLVNPVWKVGAMGMPPGMPPGFPMGFGQPMGAPQGGPALDPNQFNQPFATALATDVQKLLVVRGFTVGGPYASLDEMTFPQKKQSDLVLTPQIQVTVSSPQMQSKMESSPDIWNGGAKQTWTYSTTGACSASGFISFEVIEPLSAQKVWLKKVDVAAVQEDCSSSGDQPRVATTVNNGVARVMEKVYGAVMAKAATYFVKEEMDLVKKQSADLREKKVY